MVGARHGVMEVKGTLPVASLLFFWRRQCNCLGRQALQTRGSGSTCRWKSGGSAICRWLPTTARVAFSARPPWHHHFQTGQRKATFSWTLLTSWHVRTAVVCHGLHSRQFEVAPSMFFGPACRRTESVTSSTMVARLVQACMKGKGGMSSLSIAYNASIASTLVDASGRLNFQRSHTFIVWQLFHFRNTLFSFPVDFQYKK